MATRETALVMRQKGCGGIGAGAVRLLSVAVLGMALALAPAQQTEARAAPQSFADLADAVSPAVVNITTSTTVAAPAGRGLTLPEGSPFEEFFRDFMNPEGNGPRAPQHSAALGSGFVISEDGYIVTNNHVIDGADEIEIEFFSGNRLPATVVGTDPNTDIAVLKVTSDKPLPFVKFGDSNAMRVGDWVVAMGNPLGQGFSLSAGIVSARKRELQGTYDDYIQTDAAINRGNSGGPLFNMEGQVIGVNTAILSPNGGSIGIGFSMASNVVAKVVDQLRQFGETRRGWLGVRIQDVTPDVAEAMNLGSTQGALVTDVPDGPAKDAGMQSGDLITAFDGASVTDTRDLVRRVGDADVGKPVRVVVKRGDKSETLLITLGRREDADTGTPAATEQEQAGPAEAEMLGMTLSEVSPELVEQYQLADDIEGLVITRIDEESPAFKNGLREGDVIAQAEQQPVAALDELEQRIEDTRAAGRKSLLLLVVREGARRFVGVPLDE